MLPKLNFPDFSFRIRKGRENELKIFDSVRKKFVVLSPEEWVRQHVLHYLVEVKSYPASLIQMESGLSLNNTQKRTDILVYNAAKAPVLLVECKSYKVAITQNTLDQALRYNLIVKAPCIVLSNGLKHVSAQIIDNEQIKWIMEIPEYQKK